MTPVRVAVIGLGLIGGSVARRLARSHDVTGWDTDPATRELAAAAGLAVAAGVEDAAAGADVTVLATPLAALATVLTALSTTDCPVLTDVGSVKAPVLAAARAAGVADRFVGGHPMAGTERAGFAAADPALLDGAAWVLCVEDDTDLTAWLRVAELVTGAGGHAVPCRAADHDDAQARISGLPHLLALALAVAGAAAARSPARSRPAPSGTAPGSPAAARSWWPGSATATAPRWPGCSTRRWPGWARRRPRCAAAAACTRSRPPGTPPAGPGPSRCRRSRRRWTPAPADLRAGLRELGAAGGAVHAVQPDGTLHCRRPDRRPPQP